MLNIKVLSMSWKWKISHRAKEKIGIYNRTTPRTNNNTKGYKKSAVRAPY